MVLKIRKIKDEALSQKCRIVAPEEFNADLEKLLSDMAETMYANQGAGLAAPQIGDLRRFLVADLGHAAGEQYGTRSIKMVNPEIVGFSEFQQKAEEGCLSFPGFPASVTRAENVTVIYQTPAGESVTQEFQGLEARIIQHEIDHLNGITLFSRASAFKRSSYLKRINNMVAKYYQTLA